MLAVPPALAPPSPPRSAPAAAVSESFFLSLFLFSNNSIVRYTLSSASRQLLSVTFPSLLLPFTFSINRYYSRRQSVGDDTMFYV